MDSYKTHSIMIETNGTKGKTTLQEFHPKHNKPIIDKIEDIVGGLYDMTTEEIEYIKNYDLRFRMSEDE